MQPQDNHPYSILVYADWLEENDQIHLSQEIREEIYYVNNWVYEYTINGGGGVGGVGGGRVGGRVGGGSVGGGGGVGGVGGGKMRELVCFLFKSKLSYLLDFPRGFCYNILICYDNYMTIDLIAIFS